MMKIVSIMPAFKVEYIMESIYSIALQSYPVSKLIISDDSIQGDVINYLNSKNIKEIFPKLEILIVNGPKKGPWENVKYLVSLLSDDVDLFHVMTDDDLIYPDFMRKHMLIHKEIKPLISISKRWVLHKTGQPVAVPNIPLSVYTNSNLYFYINYEELIKNSIVNLNNYLGELPQSLIAMRFKDKFLNHRINEIKYSGLEDIGSFLLASKEKGLVFINENLGGFRRHPNQNTTNYKNKINFSSTIGWIALLMAIKKESKLNEMDVNNGIEIIFKMLHQRDGIPNDSDFHIIMDSFAVDLYEDFQSNFLNYWESYAW
jgi:hypothetical protein